MKTFKEFIRESEALSLDYGNSSMHFSKEAALKQANKLHKSGHIGIKIQGHPNGLHVVSHEGKKEIKEDGMGAGAVSAGPTNVTGVATSTDPVSATAVRPKKKKTPIILPMARRKLPKA